MYGYRFFLMQAIYHTYEGKEEKFITNAFRYVTIHADTKDQAMAKVQAMLTKGEIVSASTLTVRTGDEWIQECEFLGRAVPRIEYDYVKD